jgi:Iron-containing alcohol dehydrogenase
MANHVSLSLDYRLSQLVAPIAYLTTIEFGAGALSTLPEQLAAVGIVRPLIVSDRGLAATGLLQRIESLCPPGAPVFLDVPPNPTEAASRAALAVYQAHQCDGLCARARAAFTRAEGAYAHHLSVPFGTVRPSLVPHTTCMKFIRNVIFVFMLSAVALATSACPEKGPVQKAGEKIDNAVDKTKDAAKDATK